MIAQKNELAPILLILLFGILLHLAPKLYEQLAVEYHYQ